MPVYKISDDDRRDHRDDIPALAASVEVELFVYETGEAGCGAMKEHEREGWWLQPLAVIQADRVYVRASRWLDTEGNPVPDAHRALMFAVGRGY